MKSALFVLAIGFFAGAAALAAPKTETIKVSGWKCDQCPPKTAAKLKALDGVETAAVDREKGVVTVKYDDARAKHKDLEKAIADSGFAVAK